MKARVFTAELPSVQFGRMKNCALLIVSLFLLTSCGGGSTGSNGDGRGGARTTSFTPLMGKWKVAAKICGGAEFNAAKETIMIDKNASNFAHVKITEDSATQLCKQVDGYTVLAISTGRTEQEGRTTYTVSGEFMPSAVRKACWKKNGTILEAKPYPDDTTSVSGPSFVGTLTQSQANRLKFESAASPLCQGQATTMILTD